MKKSLILMSALALGACAGGEPGAVPRSEDPAAVTVSTIARTPDLRTFPATVAAAREANLATRMAGTILEFNADVGSRVSAGDTLVVLDSEDIQARIRAAEAQAELARKAFTRVQNLFRDGAASQAELDGAQARLSAAEAAAADARVQGRYAVLTAPFAGTVTRRMADPGDLAGPGQPILTLTGSGGLEVQADLPSEFHDRVQEGMEVPVLAPETGFRGRARITRVVSALEPGSRRFRVEARLLSGSTGPEGQPSAGAAGDAPGTLPVPGTYVRIGLRTGGPQVHWIPADAVVRRGQLTGVYVVEGEELRLRWVRLGEERDGAVELLASPEGSEQVVRRPAAELFDGQPVRSVSTESWTPGPSGSGMGSDAAPGAGAAGEEVTQ